MIGIYSRPGSSWAEGLREELLHALLPCVLIGPEYGFTALLSRLPLLIVEPQTTLPERIRYHIPLYKTVTWSQDHEPLAAICDAYRKSYGADPLQLHSGGVRFVGGQVYYRGVRLRFTPSEKRILTLMLACQGIWFTAEETAALTMRSCSGNAAAVHICNLNKKCMDATAYCPIECRRYKGYRIPPEPDRSWLYEMI